jgi:hypothetical protein
VAVWKQGRVGGRHGSSPRRTFRSSATDEREGGTSTDRRPVRCLEGVGVSEEIPLSAKPAQRRMISLLQGKRRTFRAQDSFLGSDVPPWTDDPGTWPQHQKAFELIRTADLDLRCSFARSAADSGRVACEEQVVLERRKRPGPRVRPSSSRAESVEEAAGWTVPDAPARTGRPVASLGSWLADLPGRTALPGGELPRGRFIDLGPICQDMRIVKLVIQVLPGPDLEGDDRQLLELTVGPAHTKRQTSLSYPAPANRPSDRQRRDLCPLRG